jgi:glycosidase
MHVIIDGVFNHVGTTFWAFRDVRTRGKASPYAEWFTVTSWDDPATPADEFDYRGWIGIKDLPEWREDAEGLVAGPRDHVHAVVRRWMDPNGDGDPSDGIDGWRLDVAEMVALPFWRQFRSWVRGINPEAYLTGEIWWEDWGRNKMFNAAPWLRGDAFDAVMNYRWAAECLHWVRDRKNKISASEFAARLDTIRADYRPEATAVLMNLFASHDTDRLGSMLVNVDATFDHRVSASDNPEYDVRKPGPAELRQQRLLLLLQMTYVGAPMVYYGEEAGMWGGDDPDERKPMVWPDMTFDPETHHPLGKARPHDAVAFDSLLHRDYRTLMRLRSTEPALCRGTYRVVLTDDRHDAFAFERALGADRFLVLLNNGPAATVQIPMAGSADGTLWTDVRSGESLRVEGGGIAVPVDAVAGRLLKAAR